MPLLKNVAGQKIAVFAYDVAAGAGKTGDAANITAQIVKDFGANAALDDLHPAEVDAINHKGWYAFDLLQAETNADCIIITVSSTTAGIRFAPLVIYPTVYDATKAGYLDGAISVRAVEAGGNVAAIKAKTDNLPANPAAVGSAMTLTAAYDAAKTAAPESGGNLAAVKAKTDNLPASPADESNVETHVSNALAAYDPPTKAELDNAVSPLALEANVQAHVAAGLAAYDPPTRAELTSDKNEIIAQVDANEVKIDLIDTLVDAIKAKTDGLPADPASQAAILAAVGALNDISVSDLLTGNLADDQVFPANSLADLLRKLFWVLCNRLRITDATGAFTGYKSDGVTPAVTGTIDDDGTHTERSTPTWP